MKHGHGGDELEDDFVPDGLVALENDEDVFVDDEGQTPEEDEEDDGGTSSNNAQSTLASKKRKRREKEKERKVCLSFVPYLKLF
jgi:protein CMS1